MAKKTNSPVKTVAVIEEFLAGWKAKAFKYYSELRVKFVEERSKQYEITKENLESILKNSWSDEPKYSDEDVTRIMNKFNAGEMAEYAKANLISSINHSKFNSWKNAHTKSEIAIVEGMYDEKYLDKVLDREVDSKRKTLIARIEKKAGEIQDAKGLHIGENGEINGTVIGEKATVKVQTVFAGGYNIQILHYRVLVKEIK